MNGTQLRSDIAVGVDGCPGGWVAAIYQDEDSTIAFEVVARLGALIDAHPGVAIGVDIPIGLGTGVTREVDAMARARLCYPRAFSVFPPPDRRVLGSRSWEEANALSKELIGKGLSRQSYGIMRKIEEADDVITDVLQGRVFELHPELCFWRLAGGRPMEYGKKRTAGFNERRDLLQTVFPAGSIPATRAEALALVRDSRLIGRGAGSDDVLDAIVAAWTALRFARGEAEVLPTEPQRDERGLLMQIVC